MTRRIILVDIGAGLILRGVLPSVAKLATYSARLIASGGQPPYTYAIVGGALPVGLYLDAATGTISGTASTAGIAAFTVRATDLSGAHVERLYSITVIAEPLTLSGDAPNGQVGVPYSFNYAASGGVPPYVFDIASGVLPAGLSINAATGALTGTPTNAGSVFWTVRVTDTEGATTIADGAVISYETLALAGAYAAATVGTAYSSDLTISGGDGSYSNPRVTVGALPAGLALSIVSGKLRLSGTPTAAATSNFTVAVDSGDGQTATSAQSVVVAVGKYYDSLFAAGELGFIVDFNDLSTLFQDAAHTVPVTTVGQSIRAVMDKANPGTYATCAAGNTLQYNATKNKYFCRCNGTAPFTMAIVSALGGNASKGLVAVADTTSATTNNSMYVCNLGGSGTSNSLFLAAGKNVSYNTTFGQGGTGQAANIAYPNTMPLVLVGNKDVNTLYLYSPVGLLNSIAVNPASITTLSATIGGYPSAGFYLIGDIYSVVCLNRILTSTEITAVMGAAL